MDDAPNPADEDKSEKELADAEQEGHAVEVITSASGNHGSNARGERNAVQDEAYNCEGVIEFDDRGFACSYCLICTFFHHIKCLFFVIKYI